MKRVILVRGGKEGLPALNMNARVPHAAICPCFHKTRLCTQHVVGHEHQQFGRYIE